MGKQLMLSIILIYTSFVLKANDSLIILKSFKTVNGAFKNFNVDNLGNIYLITPSNQIKKLNNNFDSVTVFNDTRQYGNISQIDVSNPLKILVFYTEFSTVLVLDRFLNVRTKIDLRKQNIFKASAICLSFDNYIWIFDELENKLKKISDDGSVLMESNDFRLVLDTLFVPETIVDNNGLLFLYQPSKGVVISDYYGAFKKVNPIINLKHFQLYENNLIGFVNNILQSYSLNLFQLKNKKVVELSNNISKIIIRDKYFYQLKQNQFEVKTVE
jgi:hypothetical protein